MLKDLQEKLVDVPTIDYCFTEKDIKDLAKLTKRITEPEDDDELAKYLKVQLSNENLLDSLNEILKKFSLYDEASLKGFFASKKLDITTKELASKRPQKEGVVLLNRLLMRDVYSKLIEKKFPDDLTEEQVKKIEDLSNQEFVEKAISLYDQGVFDIRVICHHMIITFESEGLLALEGVLQTLSRILEKDWESLRPIDKQARYISACIVNFLNKESSYCRKIADNFKKSPQSVTRENINKIQQLTIKIYENYVRKSSTINKRQIPKKLEEILTRIKGQLPEAIVPPVDPGGDTVGQTGGDTVGQTGGDTEEDTVVHTGGDPSSLDPIIPFRLELEELTKAYSKFIEAEDFLKAAALNEFIEDRIKKFVEELCPKPIVLHYRNTAKYSGEYEKIKQEKPGQIHWQKKILDVGGLEEFMKD